MRRAWRGKREISDQLLKPFPDSLFLSFQLIPSRTRALIIKKKNYNSSSNPLILWYAVRYSTTGSPIKVPGSIAFAKYCHVNTSSMGSFNYQPEVSEIRNGKRCDSLELIIASSGSFTARTLLPFQTLSSP